MLCLLAATENYHHLLGLIDPLVPLHFLHIGQNLRSCSRSLHSGYIDVNDWYCFISY
jgi:hypothetical protein